MNWRRYYKYSINVHLTQKYGEIRHLRVQKLSEKGGISWDTLQRIKNETLGSDVLCVEVYPPDAELVDNLNMRHLWEVPQGVEHFPFNLWTPHHEDFVDHARKSRA